MRRRFTAFGLDRIWATVSDLAEATQWHQFQCLQYEIGQMRRHDSIQGYVVTELTDAYWEANGLLDPMRGRKVYHDKLKDLIADDVVVVDAARRDVCSLERLQAQLHLSCYGPPSDHGRIEWEFVVHDGPRVSGKLEVPEWPDAGARLVGSIDAEVPDIDKVSDADLTVRAFDAEGRQRAQDVLRFAVVPASARRTSQPLGVGILDPLDIWGVTGRVEALGHRIVPPDQADVVIATEITDQLMDRLDAGGRALVLVRTREAIPENHDLARRVSIHLRRVPHSGWPGQRSPWEGDWVTSWSWILPDGLPGLPKRNPLDFAYEEVLPDHVLLGYDPQRHRDEVPAGMFVGWVHTPAANVWTFPQGSGAITLTTFRVAPESGPVATLLLERLIQQAAAADGRSSGPREADVTRAAVPA
jgi:hypothetical protein